MRRLISLDDLAQLEPRSIRVDEQEIALVRVGDDVYAFSARCTHRPAPLADGAVTWKRTLICPWHLGTFDLRDGRILAGPPARPLELYPIRVIDGVVWLRDAEAPGQP